MALQKINDRGGDRGAGQALVRARGLRERAPEAVAGRADLDRKVVIEPGEHREFGDLLVRKRNRPERVMERAAASKMMAEPIASVFVSPALRSAMRRIASPGR